MISEAALTGAAMSCPCRQGQGASGPRCAPLDGRGRTSPLAPARLRRSWSGERPLPAGAKGLRKPV